MPSEPGASSAKTLGDDRFLAAIRRLRAGEADEQSSRLLDERLRPRLLRYFLSHAFSREDAEDLVQKTLSRVFLGMGQLRAEESFWPWLFTIARNLRRTTRERERRELGVIAGGLELAEAAPDPRSHPRDPGLREERLQAVRRAIEGLPAQQRQCLVLQVREEMSYEEVAETLRLSVHTVRNHLAQARKSLRRALESVGLEGEPGR